MLEPCAVKVARTVLRGVGGRKATYLPDKRDFAETISPGSGNRY